VDNQENLVLKDREVTLEMVVSIQRVQKVIAVLTVTKVLKVHLDLMGYPERKVTLDWMELLVVMEKKV
jgi:hypothetical protein